MCTDFDSVCPDLDFTVYDSNGAVIAGAQVTAINEETGVTYRQQTTGSGLYAFASLQVGKYTIVADVKGFKTARHHGPRPACWH